MRGLFLVLLSLAVCPFAFGQSAGDIMAAIESAEQNPDVLTFDEWTPIDVAHAEGARVQVLPWTPGAPPRWLPEKHFKRPEQTGLPTMTFWAARPGDYLLNAGTGAWKIVTIRPVGNPPPPEPPPEPPPGPPTGDFVQSVKAWALVVGDKEDSQRYALIAEICRDGVDEGKLSVGRVWEVLKASRKEALSSDWDGFASKLNDEAALMLQRGTLTTPKQYFTFLDQLRYGLELSAEGSFELPEAEGVRVLAIVNKHIRGGQ